MKKDQLFLSTIAPDAAEEARRHGLGLEIAEYCTAWNMDEQFETTHAAVAEELTGVGRRLLHAPFSELFPCAVDPKARELAALRYRQAIALAGHQAKGRGEHRRGAEQGVPIAAAAADGQNVAVVGRRAFGIFNRRVHRHEAQFGFGNSEAPGKKSHLG